MARITTEVLYSPSLGYNIKKERNMESEKKRGDKKAKLKISPFFLTDNGGRRSGIERRRFSYSLHIPERRSGTDRRKIEDRRREADYSESLKRKKGKERRAAFLRLRDHVESGDLDTVFPQVEDPENKDRLSPSEENQES